MLLLGCGWALSTPAWAQRVLEAKGFQSADNFGPPNETQIKSLLKGERARPLENGKVQVFQAELSTFNTNGQPELFIRAPECLYDQPNQEVSSPGPLHVQTADGRFSIEGEGFLWQQTNSVLLISNQVHTVVKPELMEGPNRNARAKEPAKTSPIEIFSHRFEYNRTAGQGVYREAVRVTGTDLDLASGRLTLLVPMSETNRAATLQSVTAQENVALAYGGIHATGDTAVYAAQTGLATLTGHPAWRAEQREGRGDELVIDRTNRIFKANGHAWLRMPGQTFGSSGFLAGTNRLAARTTGAPPGVPALAGTNGLASHTLGVPALAGSPLGANRLTPAAAATNRWVEINSDNYEFHTNSAVFNHHVQVHELVNNQPAGNLACATLTAHFTGTNELQNLVAEKHVVIREGDKRFAGETAVFNGTNGVLTLTGKPSWKAGTREGNGNELQVDSQRNEMLVRGNASMKLPAEELGQGTALAPAAARKPQSKPETPQVATIFCEEYRVQPERAVFRGGVYATHPRMNWTCEVLTVLAPTKAEKVLIAEQGVTFDLDLANEKHDKIHGTGDKAEYTNSITSALTNDLLTLTGSPARLATANATNENNVILLDRARNQLISRGNYRVFGTTKAMDTNVFSFPKTSVLKK